MTYSRVRCEKRIHAQMQGDPDLETNTDKMSYYIHKNVTFMIHPFTPQTCKQCYLSLYIPAPHFGTTGKFNGKDINVVIII
jgi:hypothetical protein